MNGGWTDIPAIVDQAFQLPQKFEWMLVEKEETTQAQREQIRDACHALGKMCGVWESAVDYGTPAHAADGFDCYVGQVEGPGQYDRFHASLSALRVAHPVPFPVGCVTNTGGFENDAGPGLDPDKAKPFIDADVFCISESHIAEEGGVDHTETRLDQCSRVLGWPGPQPMAGLGMGATLDQYTTLQSHSGWSVFALEQLLG